MAKYKVDITDLSGNFVETLDETFDSYEDAKYEAQQCISDYSVGADVLRLAGEDYSDPNDIDYKIYEIT